MKIGILTMVYEYNYGGILQCMALQNLLSESGHNVEVIKYVPTKRSTIIHKFKQVLFSLSCRELSNIIKKHIGYKHKRKDTKYEFSQLFIRNKHFIKCNINYTEECNEGNIGKLIQKNKYEAVIIGSDKIWGGIGQEKLIYFGEWEPLFKGILISYAACSSRDKIPYYNKKKIEKLLDRFTYLSVRDGHTKDLFKCLTTKEINIVCDPTLLYDFHFKMDRAFGKPYLLIYVLGDEIKGGHKAIIDIIKKRYNIQRIIAIVLPHHSIDVVKYADEVVCDATPDEWTCLIKNATFIYTDSFHGVVFSLKYRKQFVGYYKELARATRLLELKNNYQLDNIISSSSDYIEDCITISDEKYEVIHLAIEENRQKSVSYLTKALTIQ